MLNRHNTCCSRAPTQTTAAMDQNIRRSESGDSYSGFVTVEVAALIGVNQKCPSVAAEVVAATLGELQSVTIAFHCVLL